MADECSEAEGGTRDERPQQRRRREQRRLPLCEISNNQSTMPPGATHTAKGTGKRAAPDPTPTAIPRRSGKRRAITTEQATVKVINKDGYQDGDGDKSELDPPDPDVTPRAPSTIDYVSLPPPPTCSDKSSNASSRASSPTKMAGLVKAAIGYQVLDMAKVAHDQNHPLYDVRHLLELLDDFSVGYDVLPEAMKVGLRANPDHNREFRGEHMFDASERRSRLGTAPAIERVLEIVDETVECMVNQEHEAAWNSDVQRPIAQLAASTSRHAGQLKLKNITVAKIQPARLAPKFASGPKLKSKMVDFAYVLQPTQSMHAAYANLDQPVDAAYASFNHTCHSSIITRPIAISLETKALTAAGDDALPQIAIWAAAHFNKLADLTALAHQPGTPLARMPILFLPIAHGYQWTFCAASKNDVSGVMTLHRLQREISANSKLGVYQVVACLHALIDWAVSVYRPWFENSALPLTKEERALYLEKP